MTSSEKAREIAEKIVGENIDGNKYHEAKIKLIAAALQEFGGAQYKRGLHTGYAEEAINCDQHCQKAESEGYRRGAEDAAKVAEFHSGPSVQCADKIRALVEGK